MNILIAVDGSECSEAAIQDVIRTRPRDTQIQIVHAIEPLPVVESWAYAVNWQQIFQEQRKEAEAFVAQAAKALQDAGFTVTSGIEEGSAKSIIIDTAAKWPADLVVVGSRGRRGLARFLLGSVSEAVARYAPCSVQIVRAKGAS